MFSLQRKFAAKRAVVLCCSGIVSSVLTNNGEGFYPGSPSEFVRFSLSARAHTKPDSSVDVKPGLRPALPEPVTADGEAVPAEVQEMQAAVQEEQPAEVAAAAVPVEQPAAAAV